jgi:polyisoprenyl-teichoic acid--peptidoglycan teichoic acid transferase
MGGLTMRYERNHKQKKQRWKTVLVTFVLLILAVSAYAYYQYQQGVSQSLKKVEKKDQVVYKFEGNKDQYGDTNILLLGSDRRGNERSRSDTIMIASYNENKGSFKLASIMRDSYVDIPGHGKHKINSAFAYGGPELMRQTIKENFGVDLQYYAIVDFQGFVQLIDEAFPDGVEVNVEKEMSTNIGVTLKPGLQKLDGKHLLGYVRFRHDAIGDFGRVKRQQKVIKLLGDQLKSVRTIPKLPKLVGVVSPYVNTNMNTTDILFMAKDYLTKGRGNVATLRIPIENSFTEPRISGEGDILDIDLEKNRQALDQFLSK